MIDDYNSLTVVYKGVPHLRLNARLVAQKELSREDVETIKALHQERLSLEGRMAEDSRDLKLLYSWWLENQRDLQAAWKFEQNDNFIRFWEVPQCSCPKMDNGDAYTTGYYTVNSNCPVHGA